MCTLRSPTFKIRTTVEQPNRTVEHIVELRALRDLRYMQSVIGEWRRITRKERECRSAEC